MVRLVRLFGMVVGASALFAIPMSTGQGVAMAAASCGGFTARSTSTVSVTLIPSTSDGSGNYNCIAGQGTTGDGVVQIQKELDVCKGEKLAQDGIYGPLTAAAVARQQTREHVTADGVYGPITRSHGFPMEGINFSTGNVYCTTAGF